MCDIVVKTVSKLSVEVKQTCSVCFLAHKTFAQLRLLPQSSSSLLSLCILLYFMAT